MKVLIAEDDPNTRAALKEILSNEGFDATAVENGGQAIHCAAQSRFDLICLDIMMPDVDGFSACRTIRKSGDQTPILFISAKSEDNDQAAGLDLGADDFIVKPFSVTTLLARIRAVLRRARVSNNSETENFELGDLRIIPGELRALRGETSIDLSPRDIAILTIFSQRPGKVIDRDTLLNEAWGLNYYPNSRCVDQHVSQLRKRIETDVKSPRIIKTVHGAGYRYDA